MTTDGQREVTELHAFFEAWFTGALPRTPEAFARFADVMSPAFQLVTPHGHVHARPKLDATLEADHGTWKTGEHRIWIENYIHRDSIGGVTLATYEEWQNHNGKSTGRLSTVVFREEPSAPNGVLWVHVHETLMG